MDEKGLESAKTIEGIIEECLEDSKRWFPKKSQDLPFLVLALCGEAGELANLVKKIIRGTHKLEDNIDDVREEAVDVFIYLMNILGVLEVDIIKAYDAKRMTNNDRFTTWKSNV